MANDSLQEYFEKQNIVAIDGIDTRALGDTCSHPGRNELYHFISDNTDIDELKKIIGRSAFNGGLELASIVSTKKAYDLGRSKK